MNQKKANPTKRQHYVPKMLLRNFTEDGILLDVYAIKRKKWIRSVSIKEQCAADYYYGTDGSIENDFGHLESDTQLVFAKIFEGKLNEISEEEWTTLRIFINFQAHRTLGAANEYAEQSNALTKKLVLELARKKYPELKGEDFNVVNHNPQFQMLRTALSAIPLMLDLDIKILYSGKSAEFIIGDHPVTLYNQFAENILSFSHVRSHTGLISKGLQIFLPISPWLCVALFDPTTYKYGKENWWVCRIGNRDVNKLNKLQTMNANLCIYSHPKSPNTDRLEQHLSEREAFREPNDDDVRELPVIDANGRRSKILNISKRSIRCKFKLSCVSVIEKNKYYGYNQLILPPRSSDIVKIHKEHDAEIEKMIKERSLMTTTQAKGQKRATVPKKP